MTEYTLIGVIALLLAYMSWREHLNKGERKQLLNAILAKNANEMAQLELADKTEIIQPQAPSEPDLILESDADDEDFSKYLEGDKNNG